MDIDWGDLFRAYTEILPKFFDQVLGKLLTSEKKIKEILKSVQRTHMVRYWLW